MYQNKLFKMAECSKVEFYYSCSSCNFVFSSIEEAHRHECPRKYIDNCSRKALGIKIFVTNVLDNNIISFICGAGLRPMFNPFRTAILP